jgi:hypothetical protein
MTAMRRPVLVFLLLLLLAACRSPEAPSSLPSISDPTPAIPRAAASTPPVLLTATSLLPTAAARPTVPAPSPSPTLILQPTLTFTPPPVSFYDPAGCRKPPDGKKRLEVNGWVINERTLAMLQYAKELYAGPVDITAAAITQGSYHDNGAASFGTHLGGGAVDLAIFQPGTWSVDFAHLQRLVRALRTAGFAAWVRDLNEVFPGSGYHIHAIAIGDPELSKEAVDQLTGPDGYFRGYNGLPKPDGKPVADRDGGMVLCAWMLDLGYKDLRADPSQPLELGPAADWPQRLLQASINFQTTTTDQTLALARSLDYLPGKAESPATMDGPLAAALWRAAGLLPGSLNKANLLGSYVYSSHRMETLWAMLPPDDYAHFHFEAAPQAFDFSTWRLQPGDLVELKRSSGQARMFVVTEMGPGGKIYTVTTQKDAAGGWRVERLLLYDPARSDAGMLQEEWVAGYTTLDVLRYRWIDLPSGAPVSYKLQPGESLPELAARFGVDLKEILSANPGLDAAHPQVGELVSIPH